METSGVSAPCTMSVREVICIFWVCLVSWTGVEGTTGIGWEFRLKKNDYHVFVGGRWKPFAGESGSHLERLARQDACGSESTRAAVSAESFSSGPSQLSAGTNLMYSGQV